MNQRHYRHFFIVILSCVFVKNSNSQLSFSINDSVIRYTGEVPENTYHKYCKNVYSQNGEDGILEQILKELKITKGTFCEFGASNGITSSNTYRLIKEQGFSGVAIELDAALYQKCVQNYSNFKDVRVFHGGVFYQDKENNLNAWLKRGNLPYDFDVLSIDIDYDDYYVWQGLSDFAPKIVIFETNPYRDPIYDELPGKACIDYNIDLLREWKVDRVACGCSFISAVKLGLSKGYIPVSYTGNIIFVRKDLVSKLKEFPYKISDNPYDYIDLYSPLAMWKDSWHTNTVLILNVAIRDYYLAFGKRHIDVAWLNWRMQDILRGAVF